MLQVPSNLAINKLIVIKNNINGVSSSKIILKANVVGNEFGARFFIPKARLAFTKLRQAFTTTPILHHFDPDVIFGLKLVYQAMPLAKSSVC